MLHRPIRQNEVCYLPDLWHPACVFGITDLPTYLAGLAVIIVMPGPNSLYVLSVAARLGVRQGYRAAFGVFCGDTTLMVLSAAGVASLLRTSPLAFSIIKVLGAGYLTWLAVGMLRGAWRAWRRRTAITTHASTERALTDGAVAQSGTERPYRRALMASLLNPKAILFFVSFFVQFVDPAYPYPVLSFLVLGFWVQLFSVTYLSFLIFSGARLAAAFRRRRALQVGGAAAAGGAFLAFAVKLSLASAA
jgi:leucine efflux protein